MTTAIKHSPSFKTWTSRLADYMAGGPVPESMFSAMCSNIRGSARVSPDTKDLLLAKIVYGTPKVDFKFTDAQTVKGIPWLRRSNIYRHLGPHDRKIVDNFSNFSNFSFPRVQIVPRGNYGMIDARPVYRVHDHNGHWFDYVANPWQSSAWGNKEPFTIIAKQ